jgi:hypothetical protein
VVLAHEQRGASQSRMARQGAQQQLPTCSAGDVGVHAASPVVLTHARPTALANTPPPRAGPGAGMEMARKGRGVATNDSAVWRCVAAWENTQRVVIEPRSRSASDRLLTSRRMRQGAVARRGGCRRMCGGIAGVPSAEVSSSRWEACGRGSMSGF